MPIVSEDEHLNKKSIKKIKKWSFLQIFVVIKGFLFLKFSIILFYDHLKLIRNTYHRMIELTLVKKVYQQLFKKI
jgi:hypothetical protein